MLLVTIRLYLVFHGFVLKRVLSMLFYLLSNSRCYTWMCAKYEIHFLKKTKLQIIKHYVFYSRKPGALESLFAQLFHVITALFMILKDYVVCLHKDAWSLFNQSHLLIILKNHCSACFSAFNSSCSSAGQDNIIL